MLPKIKIYRTIHIMLPYKVPLEIDAIIVVPESKYDADTLPPVSIVTNAGYRLPSVDCHLKIAAMFIAGR